MAEQKNEAGSKRKSMPSRKRIISIYATNNILDECHGAENRSNRISDLVRGYALMRRALCPVMPTAAWSAVMSVLITPLPKDLEDSEIAQLIASRMSVHESEMSDRLNINVRALIEEVSGWSPERAWAVADVGWRFWRMTAQLGVRQKLTLLGITPAA